MSKFTTLPERGDIATYGADRKVRFVKFDNTYNGIPSGQTAFGLTVERNGNDVLIRNKTAASKAAASAVMWKFAGYAIDGEEHTFTIMFNAHEVTVTHSASTIAGLAAAINTAIGNGGQIAGEHFCCYERDGELVLQQDTLDDPWGVDLTVSDGITLAPWLGHENRAFNSCIRNNGEHNGEGAIINFDRSLIYFNPDNPSRFYNPDSDVTSVRRAFPICKPGYLGTSQIPPWLGDHCAYLRSIYGEGEEGWIAFMHDMEYRRSLAGNNGESGRLMSYRLAGQTFPKVSGGPQFPLYQAIDYATGVGYDAEGIEQGNWYLPNLNEICAIQRGVTYPAVFENGAGRAVSVADADILTRACNAIGATVIGNDSDCWTSGRGDDNTFWAYEGRVGCASNLLWYASLWAIPCVLYKLAQ